MNTTPISLSFINKNRCCYDKHLMLIKDPSQGLSKTSMNSLAPKARIRLKATIVLT